MMFSCGTCGKRFPSGWEARDQHCNATGHRAPNFECHTCSAFFSSQDDCSKHMNRFNHFAWECRMCDETWPTEQDRKEHEMDSHLYCGDCRRVFASANSVRMHMNSRVHRGQNMNCPFCSGSFTTATGLTHHLERGSCPNAPGIDRDRIYEIVRSKDPGGLISKKLIGWTGSSQYEASSQARNRYTGRYECYFCDRDFGTLQSLNQHLESPAHQQALYHCPNRDCGQDFKTLAAIINHLESESCGFIRFDAVQKKMGNLISSNRLLQF